MAAINHPLGQDGRALASGGTRRLGLFRVNWWLLGAFMLIGATAMLPVVQTSSATTTGFDIDLLEAQAARLESEIAALETETALLRSLDRVEARAAELGLVPVESPTYLSIDEPGPAPAKLPARFQPEPIAEPPDNEPWWSVLGELIPFISGRG
jgi:hypothetical protein